jgi:parallel beta-helix repeat protein
MKLFLKAYIILLSLISLSKADIINVPADVDSIQGGIDLSVDGDTVLVQPGTYIENIDFNGKKIVVGSLTLMTGSTSYISKTIIDGDQRGSVVYFLNGEDTSTVLCGFTIMNGEGGAVCGGICQCGFWGGGITCTAASPTLSDLKITRNAGSGILLNNSNAKLENLTITENKADEGGGIHFGPNDDWCWRSTSKPIFDEVRRCNIFLNYAEKGSDLYSSNDTLPVNIFVDTFTVTIPTDSYAFFKNKNSTLDILNAKLERVNSDLFVHPDGNNNNSGLTLSQPLRTLSYALSKIITDSLNPHTIHIANGNYSENILPDIPDYLSISGESRSGVKFNSDDFYLYSPLFEFDYSKAAAIENLTITGDGDGMGMISRKSSPLIRNITFDGAVVGIYGSTPKIENIKITGTTLQAALTIESSELTIQNIEITGNKSRNALLCREDSYVQLINSTISGNKSSDEKFAGIHVEGCKDISITNSIINDNPPILTNENFSSIITITHSLLRGGKSGIQSEGGIDGVHGSYLYWLDGNTDADPMFVDTTNGDFRLKSDSPCIDAGIQDTMIVYNYGQDTLIVPPKDYIGSAPDIGAYEYGDPSATEKELILIPFSHALNQNYPNPFNPSTNIEFTLPKSEFVELRVYNILGKEVSTLVSKKLNQGNHTYTFDGSNLASGIYYYHLVAGEYREVKKMIMIK